MEINWEGITSSAFGRAFQNTKWPENQSKLMADTQVAQLGKQFRSRIHKVNSPPIVTYAGRKLFAPDKVNLNEGRAFFKFLLECQKDFTGRNEMKTTFDLEKSNIKKAFDNLPKYNLMRSFW